MKYVQVSWHLWSYSVMPTVKIGALFCPKYIKTSIIFSGNAQSFRGLRPLDPHQGLAPGPHRGPKAGPWTPPVMGFAPRRSPCTLCVHQIFSQFLYNFGRATFKSWLTPCLWEKGRVAFGGEAVPGGEGCTLNMRGRKHDSFPVWGRLALHFWGRKLDSFPIKDSITLNFRGRKFKSFSVWWRICREG